jgi:hypothetical protein
MDGIVNFNAIPASTDFAYPPQFPLPETRSGSLSGVSGELLDEMGPLAGSEILQGPERTLREGSGVTTSSGSGGGGFWHQKPLEANGGGKPGLARSSSTSSVSAIQQVKGVAPTPMIPAGVWTAPDSWAVKADLAGAVHDESSDEEDEGEEDEGGNEEDISDTGMSPMPKDSSMFFSVKDGEGSQGGTRPTTAVTGRPGTSTGRPGTRSGRPGTSDGVGRFGQHKNVRRPVHSHWKRQMLMPVFPTVHDSNTSTRWARELPGQHCDAEGAVLDDSSTSDCHCGRVDYYSQSKDAE